MRRLESEMRTIGPFYEAQPRRPTLSFASSLTRSRRARVDPLQKLTRRDA